jgi:hypothetical protein
VNSSPPIGAIAFGKSGAGYPVIDVHPDRIVLKRADGPWAVSPAAVICWELPPESTPIQVGDRVRLKGAGRVYTVVEIYDHYVGRDSNGDRSYETWARLKAQDGKAAHWKLRQLEVLR